MCRHNECRAIPPLDARFDPIDYACESDSDCVGVGFAIRRSNTCCPVAAGEAVNQRFAAHVAKTCANVACATPKRRVIPDVLVTVPACIEGMCTRVSGRPTRLE